MYELVGKDESYILLFAGFKGALCNDVVGGRAFDKLEVSGDCYEVAIS